MLISHETPISLLDTSRGYNDYDYCLVHLLPEHPEYLKFYKDSVEMGRHVLLDNSIFELGEAYDSKEFAYWIKELKPTEFIIPDVLESTEGTIESFKKFTSEYRSLPGKSIGVVQGKTYKEIVKCYNFLCKYVTKIAISFDYSFYLNEWPTLESFEQELGSLPEWVRGMEFNKWVRYSLGRVTLLHRLSIKDNYFDYRKDHHLLGCATPWEFKLYSTTPYKMSISSIDTSNPIVAAILHKKYNPVYGLHEKWSVKLVDYIGANITREQLELAFYNTSLFRKFCQ
jgi:hypothetical protein